jgi:hypothetical protein
MKERNSQDFTGEQLYRSSDKLGLNLCRGYASAFYVVVPELGFSLPLPSLY